MAQSRNAIVATGLVMFAAACLAFPFYMASSPKPVIDPSKPLSPQATFRGPYISTALAMLDLTIRPTRRSDHHDEGTYLYFQPRRSLLIYN